MLSHQLSHNSENFTSVLLSSLECRPFLEICIWSQLYCTNKWALSHVLHAVCHHVWYVVEDIHNHLENVMTQLWQNIYRSHWICSINFPSNPMKFYGKQGKSTRQFLFLFLLDKMGEQHSVWNCLGRLVWFRYCLCKQTMLWVVELAKNQQMYLLKIKYNKHPTGLLGCVDSPLTVW